MVIRLQVSYLFNRFEMGVHHWIIYPIMSLLHFGQNWYDVIFFQTDFEDKQIYQFQTSNFDCKDLMVRIVKIFIRIAIETFIKSCGTLSFQNFINSIYTHRLSSARPPLKLCNCYTHLVCCVRILHILLFGKSLLCTNTE